MKFFQTIEKIADWINSLIEFVKNLKDIIGILMTLMIGCEYYFQWLDKNWLFLLALLSSIILTFLGLIERYQKKKASLPNVLLLPATGQLHLHNKGDSEIELWGTKLANGQPIFEQRERKLLPNTFHYFFTENTEKEFLSLIGMNGERSVDFDVYIADCRKNKYIAHFSLLIKVKEGDLSIHTHQLGVRREKWSIS